MSRTQKLIFTFINALGFLFAITRFSLQGWLALLGIYSVAIFGIIHIVNLCLIAIYYSKISLRQQKVPWIASIAFPLIFLFQFDFGDSAGNLFVYELFLGDFESTEYDNYIFFISVIASFVYLINFIIWIFILIKTKKRTS